MGVVVEGSGKRIWMDGLSVTGYFSCGFGSSGWVAGPSVVVVVRYVDFARDR
jgi:hypothetical protein